MTVYELGIPRVESIEYIPLIRVRKAGNAC